MIKLQEGNRVVRIDQCIKCGGVAKTYEDSGYTMVACACDTFSVEQVKVLMDLARIAECEWIGYGENEKSNEKLINEYTTFQSKDKGRTA